MADSNPTVMVQLDDGVHMFEVIRSEIDISQGDQAVMTDLAELLRKGADSLDAQRDKIPAERYTLEVECGQETVEEPVT